MTAKSAKQFAAFRFAPSLSISNEEKTHDPATRNNFSPVTLPVEWERTPADAAEVKQQEATAVMV